MPSVNIRELRDTRRLKAWLRSGKTVELRERSAVIARIVPAHVQTLAHSAPSRNGLMRSRNMFSATRFPCTRPGRHTTDRNSTV